MDNVTVFVGLDYHQDSVRVCVMDAEGRVRLNVDVPNDAAAIDANARRFGVPVGAIEACCGAADLADELVTERGWTIAMAHPGVVNRMKQNPEKSDKTDAWLLADLTRIGYLPRVWLAPEAVRLLREMVRHRARIVAERTKNKLRLRALLRKYRLRPPKGTGGTWSVGWFHWLRHLDLAPTTRFVVDDLLAEVGRADLRVREIERELKRMVAGDAVVAELLTLKGVGLVTAVTIRAEVGRFERFGNGKQLSRFGGVTPRNASSGQRQADAGLVKSGNPGLRMVLIELAHRLIRYDPRWTAHAAQLAERGKPTNVIVAAVANRWTRWLYHRMTPEHLAAA